MTQQSTPLMFVVMDPTVNIQQLCRLCGSKTEIANRLNIFDNNEEMNLQLKLKTCLGFDIDAQDKLPKVICLSCVNSLENFSIFKTTCETTANLFLSLCDQQIPSNPLSSEERSIPSDPSPIVDGVEPENIVIKPDYTCIENVEEADIIPEMLNNTISRYHKNVKRSSKKICKGKVNARKKPLPSTFTCDLCNKLLHSRRSISRHVLLHFPPEERVSCQYCNKTYKDNQTLKSHILRHEKKFPYICDICGQGFFGKSTFEIHIRAKHTNERPFECEQCNKKFICKYSLNVHVTNIHKDKSVQWICDICNKTLGSKSTLYSHKKCHLVSIEERKKVLCSICNAKFKDHSTLKDHMRKHTGEKPFECKVCKNCYPSTSGLRIHMLTHTGERNHICEVCGSAFALARNLKIHKVSVHEGEKMYKCNDCDKSYTQNKNLNIHLRNTGHTKLKK